MHDTASHGPAIGTKQPACSFPCRSGLAILPARPDTSIASRLYEYILMPLHLYGPPMLSEPLVLWPHEASSTMEGLANFTSS